MGKGYKQAVYKKGSPQSNEHIKSCLNNITIREMQVKTVRYHLMYVRLAYSRKPDKTKC